MIFKILILLLVLNTATSVRTSEFCLLIKDTQIIEKTDEKCSGKFSYECASNFCAVAQHHCDSFINLNNGNPNGESYLYASFCRHYPYKWKQEDVCQKM